MLAWLLLGCRPVDSAGMQTPLARAWLENIDLRALSLLGGAWGGRADLVMETASGVQDTRVVGLRGGMAGFGVELIPWASGAGTLPLRLPDEQTVGDDLLGHYSGNGAAAVVIAGAATHHLHNEHDVRIDGVTIGTLVGIFVGAEWVTIDVADQGFDPGGTFPETTP